MLMQRGRVHRTGRGKSCKIAAKWQITVCGGKPGLKAGTPENWPKCKNDKDSVIEATSVPGLLDRVGSLKYKVEMRRELTNEIVFSNP
mmetsp:Transcript_11955/g.22889  ORF Transcript_11955/g.22889 Transcript_11955/m.22889 type:complete len:88 (+) Transcript_11955:1747-2010(+)